MLHYQKMIIMRQEERKRALHQHYYHHNMTTLSVIEVSVLITVCVCASYFISLLRRESRQGMSPLQTEGGEGGDNVDMSFFLFLRHKYKDLSLQYLCFINRERMYSHIFLSPLTLQLHVTPSILQWVELHVLYTWLKYY